MKRTRSSALATTMYRQTTHPSIILPPAKSAMEIVHEDCRQRDEYRMDEYGNITIIEVKREQEALDLSMLGASRQMYEEATFYFRQRTPPSRTQYRSTRS